MNIEEGQSESELTRKIEADDAYSQSTNMETDDIPLCSLPSNTNSSESKTVFNSQPIMITSSTTFQPPHKGSTSMMMAPDPIGGPKQYSPWDHNQNTRHISDYRVLEQQLPQRIVSHSTYFGNELPDNEDPNTPAMHNYTHAHEMIPEFPSTAIEDIDTLNSTLIQKQPDNIITLIKIGPF